LGKPVTTLPLRPTGTGSRQANRVLGRDLPPEARPQNRKSNIAQWEESM
jgi:hypothetical protein